jgi:hypothetical protein
VNKKVVIRKVESRKVENRKVENRKVESRRVESRKGANKKVERTIIDYDTHCIPSNIFDREKKTQINHEETLRSFCSFHVIT